MTGDFHNMMRWSGPKDQTVPRIRESGLYARVLQPQEKGVDEDLVVVGRQELGLLLGIAGHAVRCIERLYLCLQYMVRGEDDYI